MAKKVMEQRKGNSQKHYVMMFYSAKEASNDEVAISKLPRQSSACG
jgi:hypothetical protein